ncbi:MAG: alpha-1,4-glucan--maltose-1-phosphate maltosyltransferase [Gammaproteobacteria bacterium]
MISTKYRRRVVIEGVEPEIDGGRFAIKRTLGDRVIVEADVFADGHDALACVLRYRKEEDPDWHEVPMRALPNDRWQGEFQVTAIGRYRYTVTAWVDRFLSWRHELSKRVDPKDIEIALQMGPRLLQEAAARAGRSDDAWLKKQAQLLGADEALAARTQVALGEALAFKMAAYPDRRLSTTYGPGLAVVVEDERARFSSWYELFPRSCGAAGQHGAFKDLEAELSYIAAMGFDVLYLPPIHPIGRINRKGKNNSLVAEPDDVGSPWAIGADEGGHKSVHPDLGTLEDFRRLVAKAKSHGIEIALDIALQCAPDHPYMRDHPAWFRYRPDGTVQYAENPPKKYQDIYPFHFETGDWRALYEEIESVFLFWLKQGVRIFRIDNPHTKPLPLWEWIIGDIKRDHPQVIFLCEAFTRPKLMYRLAKLGFSQSYTYFAWRNTKQELIDYLTELTRTEVREYLRPNFWPNTPDIVTEYLQFGGRPAFQVRLVLAATLAANYGIYAPAFELCEHAPREPGSEEYLNSEKYQIRDWDINRSDSLKDFIGRVNRIRRDNPALQSDWSLRFHPVDNEQLICYSKATADLSNLILVVVNLDPQHRQSGWVELSLDELRLEPDQPYQLHDLLCDARYLWHGPKNYVALDPHRAPAHIFRLLRRIRSERDFDYFM